MKKIALLCIALFMCSCATIPDPEVPVWPVTPRTIPEYQQKLIVVKKQREAQTLARVRAASIVCTCLDIASTLYLVNKEDSNFKEGNPLLPNPKTNPEAFIGVKLSIAGVVDYFARRDKRNLPATKIYAGVMCGAALWNTSQLID
jgi:hypothetical protein